MRRLLALPLLAAAVVLAVLPAGTVTAAAAAAPAPPVAGNAADAPALLRAIVDAYRAKPAFR